MIFTQAPFSSTFSLTEIFYWRLPCKLCGDSEIQHVLTHAVVEIKPVKLPSAVLLFLWCLHSRDAFSGFNVLVILVSTRVRLSTAEPLLLLLLLKFYSFGVFVLSGWQNLITVLGLSFGWKFRKL